jgi:hypothetical protein
MKPISSPSVKTQRNYPTFKKPPNRMMVPYKLPLPFAGILTEVVAPLSEMTDFLTDQLRTLIASLRTLRSLPANVKVGSAEEARKMHLEQVIARRFVDVQMFGSGGEGWKEQMERFEKIATLDDLRRGSS